MASKIEELLRRLMGERNIISGDVIPRPPRNVISGRIADRPVSTISTEEMAEMDKVAAGVEPISTKPPPGRGLEPRFRPPTGRRPLTPEFPITPEDEIGARVPEVLPDTGTAPGPGFDWAKFIETAGIMGAALAPQGAFAKAGLAAAGLVRGERERGAKVATAEEDRRRFEIDTKLKEVDDALNQARLDWQKDPSNPRSMENLLRLEQEKSRLRIELETAKQPAKAAKAKKAEDKTAKVREQQVRNRVRTARNSVLSIMNRHDAGTIDHPLLTGLTPEQAKKVRAAVAGMDITGNESSDEIIQMAIDSLGEEINVEELFGPDEEATDFITDEELLR